MTIPAERGGFAGRMAIHNHDRDVVDGTIADDDDACAKRQKLEEALHKTKEAKLLFDGPAQAAKGTGTEAGNAKKGAGGGRPAGMTDGGGDRRYCCPICRKVMSTSVPLPGPLNHGLTEDGKRTTHRRPAAGWVPCHCSCPIATNCKCPTLGGEVPKAQDSQE